MTAYKWSDPPSRTAFPIAREGHKLIIAAVFVTAILAITGFSVAAILSLTATAFICWFFRDPDRITPNEEGAVVSPADGRVIKAEAVDGSPLGSEPRIKISIFMSVFNVHVNRMPCDGRITAISYNPGKFFSANLDKASDKNENNAVFFRTGNGNDICVVQIAGLVARRIICYVEKDDHLERGQRFGIICFGSRLDLYLPMEAELSVSVGEKVKAGTSTLAYIK